MALADALKYEWRLSDGVAYLGGSDFTGVNSPTFVSGLLGNCVSLASASSQRLTTASVAGLQLGDTDWTVGYWFKMPTLGVFDIVGKWGETGNQREWLFVHSGGNVNLYVSSNGTNLIGPAVTTGAPVSAATWACVLGWHDSVANSFHIQVNNGTVFNQSHSGGVFQGSAPLTVGTRDTVASVYLNGQVDALHIWQSAGGGGGVLSSGDRTAFYSAGAGVEVDVGHPAAKRMGGVGFAHGGYQPSGGRMVW